MTGTRWDDRFMAIAAEVASWSKDPQHKVGAIVVSPDRRRVAWGYNGFPKGVADDPRRLTSFALKNILTVHAEANVLHNASFDPAGCSMYCTRFPCHECAKAIIQRGLSTLVAPPPDLDHPTWGSSQQTAYGLLVEAGVGIVYHNKEIRA